MAVADASYFDWPVLPEAPSYVGSAGGAMKLTWQVAGGSPTGIAVERRIGNAGAGRGNWERIAIVAATAAEYTDSHVKPGQRVSHRLRAFNSNGESAYSNIAEDN